MKYYCIAELEITDQGWIPDYVENVTQLIEERGGRYLARTTNIEKLEGERTAPHILLILEWPSKEAAIAFYESEEYKPYLRSRTEGARSELLLVAGEDITGASQLGR
jgi:uncharacterized protein (DUF1330 family)